MKLTYKFGALLFGTVLLAAAMPLDMFLKPRDQEKLGKEVRAYYKAYSAKEDTSEIKSKLIEAIEKHNKKISKKTKEDFDLLASGEDLSAIFASSSEYPKRSAAGKMTQFSQDTPLGEPIKYALHAPKGYKASKGARPLILVIPEAEEVLAKGPKEPEKQLDEDWMLSEVRNNAVIAAVEMPSDPNLWSIRGGDVLGGVEVVMLALRQIRFDYAIDPNRVFLAGHGAGVAAAADIAATFPHIFAGVIGRAGDLAGTSPTNFGNLPTFFAGGGSGVSKFEETAKDLGYSNVTVNPAALTADIWAWVEGIRRVSNPIKINFAPSTTIGGAYWLTCHNFDPDAEVKPEISAEIDLDSNVIAITAKGISSVTLTLNDELIDLSDQVVVIANGVEHKDVFQRNLTVALNQFFRSNDSGRVYTAFQVYDLPSSKDQ